MSEEENKLNTGVEGVTADDIYRDTPVFDVDKETFYKNQRQERNRMRFPNGSKPSLFMQGTKYRSPFFVRFKDKYGTSFLNKVK